jgi:hypothetical protein
MEQKQNLDLMAAQLELKSQVLGLMSEKAQAQEIQLAILTDLEKALEKNSQLQNQVAQENRMAAGLAIDLETALQMAEELRSQLASVLEKETDLQMDSDLAPGMNLAPVSLFGSIEESVTIPVWRSVKEMD